MKDYIEILKKYLKNHRFTHCISTANMMKKYSKDFGLNENKAYIAGLLHDIAKEQNASDIIYLSKKFIKRKIIKINYLDFKLNHPQLLHGAASAEIMISELNIKDKEILEAACCHTLGGVGISDLAKYTFISDFCEPLRKYKEAKKVYKELIKHKDLISAYHLTYYYLIIDLVKSNKLICHESIDGYNESLGMIL